MTDGKREKKTTDHEPSSQRVVGVSVLGKGLREEFFPQC